VWCYGNSLSLQNFEATIGKKYVLVFGNEVKGVAQEVVNECFGVIEIPQFGTKHSLNIAVSAGIVLWDFCSKIKGIKKPNHRLGSK